MTLFDSAVMAKDEAETELAISARRFSGFTLIELLVVIAIIAILAAILFAVIAQAREKACQAACLSNEKQTTLGILQYIQDYDESFPVSVANTSTMPAAGAIIGWADAIQPYIKNVQVYQCPSEPASPVLIPQNAGYTDYWINKNASDGQQTLPLSQNPSLTLLIGEGGSTSETPLANSTARFRSNGCNGAGDTTTLDATLPVCPATNLAGGGQRHALGANYGFLDGHVKWIKNPTPQTSTIIWNGLSTFDQSGNNPTFRVRDYP